MLASLYNTVEGDSAKALVNENTHPRPTALSITLYRGLTFPDDGLTFRANASYGDKPWFDFGWVRVDKMTPGSEPDYFDPTPDENHRQLVKFWAFADVEGEKFALVDVFRKVVPPPRSRANRGGEEEFWPHPVLKLYEHVPYRRSGAPIHPFFAVPVTSVIGGACVFPCIDQERGAHDHSVGLRVLYHPPLLELCGFKSWQLPSRDLIPTPSESDVAHCESDEEESSPESSDESD